MSPIAPIRLGTPSRRQFTKIFCLMEGLREAAGKDHIWVAIRCSPFHTASAFHPIVEHLKRVFGWEPEDTAPQHLAKLEAGLAGFKTLPLSESVPLFADLMAVQWPEDRSSRGPAYTYARATRSGGSTHLAD